VKPSDEPVLSEKRDSNWRNAMDWFGCLTDGCLWGCLTWILAAGAAVVIGRRQLS
jgi:hypothetical protein